MIPAMKTIPFLPLLILLGFLTGTVHSQAPELTGTVLTNLQAVETANKALIDRQQKTLDLLDQLQTTSEQLKAFTKRG